MDEEYVRRRDEAARRDYLRWHDTLDVKKHPPRLDLTDTRRSVALPIWDTALAALRVCVEAVRGAVADDVTARRAVELDNDVLAEQMAASMAVGW